MYAFSLPCVLNSQALLPPSTRGTRTILDCGGTTPLLLRACLAPAALKFTAAFALRTVQEKRGHVPAVQGCGLTELCSSARGAHLRRTLVVLSGCSPPA